MTIVPYDEAIAGAAPAQRSAAPAPKRQTFVPFEDAIKSAEGEDIMGGSDGVGDLAHALDRGVGAFGTGANDLIAAGLALPSVVHWDLMDLGTRGWNAVTGDDRKTPDPLYRPEDVQGLFTSLVGRTDPQNAAERMAYAAGGATMGGLLTAGALAPFTSAATIGTAAAVPKTALDATIRTVANASVPQTLPQLGLLTTSSAASGAGAQGAGEFADVVTEGNPWARMVAQTVAGFAGGTLPYALSGLASAGGREMRNLVQPMRQAGRERIVGDVLNRVAGGAEVDLEAPPLPGTNYTLGQRTNNPGLLAAEKSFLAGDPEAVGPVAEMQRGVHRTARGLLSGMQDIAPVEAPATVNRGLFSALDASDLAEGAAWRAIDPANAVKMPAHPFGAAYQTFVDDLAPANRGFVPGWVSKAIDDLGDNTTIGNIVEMDKRLNAELRGLPPGTEKNTLRGLKNALRAPLEDMASQGVERPEIPITPQFRREMTTAPGQPQTLTQWLRSRGGLKTDPGGELKAMDAHRVRGLVNEKGMSLDDAARAAGEAGFLRITGAAGDAYDKTRASIDDLLEALYDDLGGRPVHSTLDSAKAERFARISGMQSELGRAGIDPTTATPREVMRALGLDERAPPPEGLDEALDRLRKARAQTIEQKQTFSEPREIRRIIEPDRRGDYLPDSQTLNRIVRENGSPEHLDALFKAAPDEETKAAVRSHVTQKLLDAAETAAEDGAGGKMLSAAKYDRVAKSLQYVINDGRVFNHQQRQTISAIAKALSMAERTARSGLKGGSDTIAKAAGNRFLDNAVLNWLDGRTTISAGIGGYSLGGPLGAAATMGGTSALSSRLRAAQEEVRALLREAILDPQLGQALMLKASEANLKMIPKRLRPKLQPYVSIAAGITSPSAASRFEQERD